MKKIYYTTKKKSLRLRKTLTRRGGGRGGSNAPKTKKSSPKSSPRSSSGSSRSSSPMMCNFTVTCKNNHYYQSEFIYTSEDSARAAAKEYATDKGGIRTEFYTCA